MMAELQHNFIFGVPFVFDILPILIYDAVGGHVHVYSVQGGFYLMKVDFLRKPICKDCTDIVRNGAFIHVFLQMGFLSLFY